MPKANKSSASAGTRKKNQAKKAAREGTEFDDSAPPPPAGGKMQRGQKKLSKAQKKALPKVKQYIPPPKPPALLIPDPLDGQGLARTLPAELVVVLRRLGKKDDVTRRKGLDELREGWVVELQRPPSKAAVEGDTEAEGEEGSEELERELKETALLEAVPVWLHNLASLLQSPFHRTVAIQLHAELLAIPSIRTAILDTLELFLLPGTQNRDILGSWLVAALEEGRRGGGAGLKSWETSFYVGEPSEEKDGEGRINLTTKIPTLIEYLSLSILDPASLHDDIHPAPVATSAPAPAPVKKGGKGKASLPPPPQATSASTEDVEAEEERTARYRIGGLTGLAWLLKQPKPTDQAILDQLLKLVLEPSLWSSLSSVAPNSDDSPPFGYRQPYVRRAAYAVLEPLLATYPEVIAREDMLSLLADNLLGCCWLESEALVWETAGTPIITLLSRHKELWDIAKDASNGDVRDQDAQDRDDDEDQDDSEDEDDDEDEVGENTGEPAAANIPAPTRSYKVFDDLLQFISTTCPAVPHKTYPLLVVIISTLPQTLLPLSDGPSPQLQTLFSHLWSPVDARLLSTHALPGQPSAFQAFLRDSVDCTSYLIGKCSKIEGGEATAKWLVGEQLGHRVWKQGVLEFGGRSAGRRTVQARPETEASTFGQLLAKLGKTSIELQSDLLDSVKTTTLAQTDPADEKTALALLPRILPVLQAVEDVNEQEEVKTAIDQIRAEVAGQCAAALEAESLGPITKAYLEVLVSTIKDHPEVVTSETQSRLVSTVQNPSRLMQAVSPDLYVSLVNSLGTAYSAHETTVSSATSTLLSSQTEQATRLALAKSLLQSKSALLTPASLDDLAEEAVQSALTDHNESAAQVTALCVNAEGALSHDALHTVLALVATSIHDSTHSLVTTQPDVRIPQEAIEIFASYAQQHAGEVIDSEILQGALVGVHHLAVLLPRLHEEGYVVPPAAQELWSRSKELRDEDEEKLAKLVLADLASLISDVSCRVEPGILVDVAMVAIPGTTATDISQRILPDISHIQDLVSEFTSRQPNPTLSIVDSVIPCPPVDDDASRDPGSFDVHGRSRGARLAEAALALIRSDRQFASSSATLLQTVLSARALAQDALAVPGASRGFFDKSTPVEYLAQVVREAEGTLSFSLASLDDVALDWHKTTSDLIKKGQAASGGLDFLQSLLVMLSERISSAADDVSARTLRDVLGRFLSQSGAGEKEAEVWLNLGMGKIDSNPTLALAVISAVKPFLLDTKPLEVAQNRLANNLAGIPAKSANAKGLPALRLLIASAPPRDAASVFIPQQRALFVLRHIASWLTSDEDLEEEFDLRVAELYAVMAPIVQDVQGAHWDSIFDLIETGLESGSLQDEHSLSFLYQCLSLLQQVRDLCETNKSLRALWTNKDVHMKLVLQLFLQCTNANSVPLQTVQDLILDLLASAPTTIIGDSGLPELSRLLGESNSYSVQCTAYKILKQVVEKRTLALILDVEASVAEAEEGHQSKIIHLPGELVEIVEKGRGITWHEEPEVELVLGQLLAWMSILDHFEDASRTLRWAYLDQLNTDGLLDQILLPMLFAMLGVSEVGAWNFASSSYAVDEFYTDLLQPEDLADLTPLASHLFYRALVTIPSALRTYYESLKDRQLSMSMLNFTARHYSPVIIQNEFAALRQPAAMAQLTEEGLNVKIAQGGGATVAAGSAGSSEAIASYVVDEQPMEIGIRLPAEFPLRGVEIRDLRRVGVPENKWRGWLMSVQQTITSRNGLILEALTVFKKNVSLHFEGVVECAICYSIISLTDRTLPTKPCRTCKNRFHASCLYKWFNSSHSSSCPLCRALF